MHEKETRQLWNQFTKTGAVGEYLMYCAVKHRLGSEGNNVIPYGNRNSDEGGKL